MNDRRRPMYLVPELVDEFVFEGEPAHEFDPVQLAKSKKGGWSATAQITPGDTTPYPGPQATLQTGAEVLTIRFGLLPVPNGGQGGASPYPYGVRCLAKVLAYVEGNTIERWVDVCHATVLSVTADAVAVTFYDSSDAVATKTPVYQVTGHITRFPRGSFLVPPTLLAQCTNVNTVVEDPPLVGPITVPDSGGFAYWPIPPNAGAVAAEVLVIDANDPANTPNLSVSAAFMEGSETNKEWDPLLNTGYIVIPPFSTYLAVTNNSGEGKPATVTVTWIIEG